MSFERTFRSCERANITTADDGYFHINLLTNNYTLENDIQKVSLASTASTSELIATEDPRKPEPYILTMKISATV